MNNRKVSEAVVRRGEDEKKFDREFWREAGHEARFAAAWQMVVESFLFQGKDVSELKLRKSVEKIVRMKR